MSVLLSLVSNVHAMTDCPQCYPSDVFLFAVCTKVKFFVNN